MLLIDVTLLCVCYHHLVLIMLKMSEINIFTVFTVYCTAQRSSDRVQRSSEGCSLCSSEGAA
jgi:hypothetical protein